MPLSWEVEFEQYFFIEKIVSRKVLFAFNNLNFSFDQTIENLVRINETVT